MFLYTCQTDLFTFGYVSQIELLVISVYCIIGLISLFIHLAHWIIYNIYMFENIYSHLLWLIHFDWWHFIYREKKKMVYVYRYYNLLSLVANMCVSYNNNTQFFVFFLYSCMCGFFRSNCFHCYAMNEICVVCGFWDTRTYKKKRRNSLLLLWSGTDWLAEISENKLRSWIFHRNVFFFLQEYFIHTMVYRFVCSHTCVISTTANK